MDNKEQKRGFSGLSDLASEVSGDIDAISSEPKSDEKPSSDTQTRSSTPRESPRNEPERKSPTSSVSIETVSSARSAGGSGRKWILGVVAVIFVIWLIYQGGQSTNTTSYNSLPQTQNYTHKSPNTNNTKEAQKLLTELGYDPGPIDGQYGLRTAAAIKAFQRDNGLIQNGWIDENLLNSLKRAKNHIRTYYNQSIRSTLVQEIKNGKARAKQMESQIKDMDKRLEDYKRRMDTYRTLGMIDEYNELVPVFNSLVNNRNDLYEDYSRLIDEVNAKVKLYNSGYR